MYKTLLSRTSPKELSNAAQIAEQGSVKLLEFGYIKAATELGKQYVNDFLVEFKVPVSQDIVSTICTIETSIHLRIFRRSKTSYRFYWRRLIGPKNVTRCIRVARHLYI